LKSLASECRLGAEDHRNALALEKEKRRQKERTRREEQEAERKEKADEQAELEKRAKEREKRKEEVEKEQKQQEQDEKEKAKEKEKEKDRERLKMGETLKQQAEILQSHRETLEYLKDQVQNLISLQECYKGVPSRWEAVPRSDLFSRKRLGISDDIRLRAGSGFG